MMNVTNKPFTVSAIMLNDVLLSVVMLNVVAPENARYTKYYFMAPTRQVEET
jgi:hypothetical protein